jgi:hypothetical protein
MNCNDRRTHRLRFDLRLMSVAALVALSLGAAASASAQTADKTGQNPSNTAPRALVAPAVADPSDTRVYAAQLKITRDAKTGQLRKPTRAETAKLVANLKAMLSPSMDGVGATPLPGGGGQLNLRGRLTEVILARPTADGTMETRCVSSMEEAAAFLGLKLVSGSAPGAEERKN